MPIRESAAGVKLSETWYKSRRTRVHLSGGIVPNMMWYVLIIGASAHNYIYVLFWRRKSGRSSINDRYLGGNDIYVSPYDHIVRSSFHWTGTYWTRSAEGSAKKICV